MNYGSYLNAGHSEEETMGDLSDTLFELAQGFLPGGYLAPVGDALAGAASGAIPTPFTTPDAPSSSTAKVTAPSGIKLRAQPNENSTQKAGLAFGTVVTVIKTGFPPTTAAPKGWTQVRTSSGTEGYVTTEWLSISTPTSASSGSATSSSSAIIPRPSPAPSPAPSGGGSLLDNKLLLIGGGVAALVVVGALVFGGKKKKAA